MIPYSEALRECKKVGVRNATGDALVAVYAGCVAAMHGGKPNLYYTHLATFKSDAAVIERARALLRDRQAAWDVLIV